MKNNNWPEGHPTIMNGSNIQLESFYEIDLNRKIRLQNN